MNSKDVRQAQKAVSLQHPTSKTISNFLGLKAFSEDYRQEFWVPKALSLGKKKKKNSLVFQAKGKRRQVSAKLERDFLPLGYSSSGKVSAKEVVFVGYGLSTENYNDYAGLDVKGKSGSDDASESRWKQPAQ